MNQHMAVTEFDKGNQLLQEGKLEDAIELNPHGIDSQPKLNYIEIEQIFKETK
jgi:hypothetical protein